jgi:NitT/TauT family transport system ATP-binding protein
MIEVDIRHMRYGETEILRQIRFTIAEGQTLAILGPSGVGKTTLLRVIAGLVGNFEGEVSGAGKLAMVFQEPTLLPWRSALDNLTLTAGITEDAAQAALAEVDLAGKEGHFPGQLSLGQQRRLSLARAFAAEPDLLLLDEPFASLDETTATAMLTLTSRLLESRNVACLLVTHAAEEAVALADRALLMAGQPGTIVGEYRIDELAKSPRADVATGLREALAKIGR